jgi:hypothetical protein
MAKSTISIFLWPCSSSQNQPIHVTDPPLANLTGNGCFLKYDGHDGHDDDDDDDE